MKLIPKLTYSLKIFKRRIRFSWVILARAGGNRWTALSCLVRMFGAQIGLPFKPKEYRIRLGDLVFHVEAVRRDIGPYGSVWIDEEYNAVPEFIASKGDTVLDVGAQMGFFTVLASRWVGDGRVICVEPDPDSYGRLCKNIEANKLTNVQTHQYALGAKEGTAYFLQDAYSAESRVLPEAREGTIEVPCTTLDKFVESEGIDRIDLLKIDTEGAERDILEHAQAVALPRTAAAIIEIHGGPGAVPPIDAIMERAGLRRTLATPNAVHYYLRSES